ncbi:tyrosine phosphatase [Fusarium beomiforme]|uniref:Tyrosine phosphatase n=1 Tax=Fusarium beomiforme TaxID=44412 RepID=A0A9P5DRJ3_9HYPO|nr:tyrosine phosphatase [Fusarium beomiforme]
MDASWEATAARLLELAETDIRTPIPEDSVKAALSSPPFVDVSGTFNTRDLGKVPGSPLRTTYAYRSAGLDSLDKSGMATLVTTLGVKRVFDLRSEDERAKAPDPEITGIENVWLPNLSYDTAWDVSEFCVGAGEEGYRKTYMSLLEAHGPIFKLILHHALKVGRDRTGVIAAVLLSLAGANRDTIALDYLLTRVGSEPVRKSLIGHVVDSLGTDLDTPGVHNLCSLRRTSWDAFMYDLQVKFGGVEGYIINKLDLTPEDVETIKKNLGRSTD